MTRLRASGTGASKKPTPSTREVKAWLAELDRLKNESGAPEELRLRVREHIEMAVVYLGWADEIPDDEER